MLDPQILSQTKKMNASINPEVTSERFIELWESQSRTARRKFAMGTADATVSNIRKKGVMSPKNALILGELYNYDPSYLTGLIDENRGGSEQTARQFLEAGDFMKSSFKPAGEKTRRTNGQAAQTERAKSEPTVNQSLYHSQIQPTNNNPAAHNLGTPPINTGAVPTIPEEQMITMIKSLYIRAAFDQRSFANLVHITGLLLFD